MGSMIFSSPVAAGRSGPPTPWSAGCGPIRRPRIRQRPRRAGSFIILNTSFLMVDARIQDVLASNLRRLRIARHLSLSELARATSMSKATLSSIENGRANPTVDTLSALAAALRVPVVELLDEPPVPPVRVIRAAGPRVLEPGRVEEVALAAFAA